MIILADNKLLKKWEKELHLFSFKIKMQFYLLVTIGVITPFMIIFADNKLLKRWEKKLHSFSFKKAVLYPKTITQNHELESPKNKLQETIVNLNDIKLQPDLSNFN